MWRIHRRGVSAGQIALALAVAAVVAAGLLAALLVDWHGDNQDRPASFEYDLEPYQKVDPSLVGYRETGRFPVELAEARAIAVGPDDQWYLAGDRAIHVHASDGKKVRQIVLKFEPVAITVGGADHSQPGRIYVAEATRLHVLDAKKDPPPVAWDDLGPKSRITSIAAGESDVYVADAGRRIVLHFDPAGKLLARIGARDEARDIPGFMVPSPYFDVAMAPDGLLRAVNPGARRVEAYTADGSLELAWGQASLGVEGFSGCCNPSNIAILPDGNIVTAEKGIPRVKVYMPDGKFVCVVATPDDLLPTPTAARDTRTPHRLKVVDVAADHRGRVLVLDPGTRSVRVFEPIAKSSPSKPTPQKEPARG